MIPLSKPCIGQEQIDGITEVLASGWLIHGKRTREFEERFAAYTGVKHAVAMNSCTSALQLAIEASDLKGEIVLPSFTFVASANAIVNSGCTPVFVDVETQTRNIDPDLIEEMITDNTVAVMPVHFAGQSCRMDRIMEIAEKHGLLVIEDSAEAIGAEFKGRKTGSFGIGCFSFFPTKNITSGEGGMLTTNDDELAARVRRLIGHGIQKSTLERNRQKLPWKREAVEPGYNYRFTDLQAAIALPQLGSLDDMNRKRREHAAYLNERLDFEGVGCPREATGCLHVYQMYTILLDEKIYDRDRFLLLLRESGIGASAHFDPPVHLQRYYREASFRASDLSRTEALSRSIVTLPMFPDLTKHELEQMVEAVKRNISLSRR